MSKFYKFGNLSFNLQHVLYSKLDNKTIYFYITKEMYNNMYEIFYGIGSVIRKTSSSSTYLCLPGSSSGHHFYIRFDSEKEAKKEFDKINGQVPECDDLISF
jgi:hypothetical protein